MVCAVRDGTLIDQWQEKHRHVNFFYWSCLSSPLVCSYLKKTVILGIFGENFDEKRDNSSPKYHRLYLQLTSNPAVDSRIYSWIVSSLPMRQTPLTVMYAGTIVAVYVYFSLPYIYFRCHIYIFSCRIYIFGCRIYIFGCCIYIFSCLYIFWLPYIYFWLPYIYFWLPYIYFWLPYIYFWLPYIFLVDVYIFLIAVNI